MDTSPLFEIMAYPSDWGLCTVSDKAMGHIKSHEVSHALSHTHARTRTSSPETAVVLNYHIRN